ncbi:MAG: exodeoxyribonuclease VII large subunit [Planctomycetes bacterium]|nr:exodeoxyribonuclease VII large subunit [Planctomycetota bacterium]
MTRPLFDPGKVAGPSRDEAPDHLTVGQLADLIKRTLEDGIASPISVVGQIGNLSTPGHWYFSLKDDDAVASCVAWASAARRFGFRPEDGDEVVATGHVSHYAPQGRTQFYVRSMKPLGAGALQVRFQQMCETLRGLGYFEEQRKKSIPSFPRRIAVITSAEGAAVHDVISTSRQRFRGVSLVLVDVRVQGEEAAGEVARAIRWVDSRRERLGVDAILVTRGGGSMEDLWAFNERVVADAVFDCTLPLVAAIGHESDTTVIELVADLRAATPTQAAMRLVPAAEDLVRQLDHLQGRLALLVTRRLDAARHRLQGLERREVMRDPMGIVTIARERVGQLGTGLRRVVAARLAGDRTRLERLAGRLASLPVAALVARRHARIAVLAERLRSAAAVRVSAAGAHVAALDRQLTAVDPRRVLGRGFSYTTGRDGKLLRSVRDASAGDRLRTHVADGAIDSEVVTGSASPRRSGADPEREQLDLFLGEE